MQVINHRNNCLQHILPIQPKCPFCYRFRVLAYAPAGVIY
ncbi:hypothetical protein L580_1375 [Serratia fonticola AU-P3(3)]|nr:hypothetical protein L580_1375 [Serratia fonticola AU-P3(3)]